MPMAERILQVIDLCISFGSRAVIQKLNFELRRGCCLAVLGPNGCGKTVLLKALLNLIPYLGEIRWTPRIRLDYVPQRVADDRQLPMEVRELLLAKAHVQNLGTVEIDRVSAAVGLSPEILGSTIAVLSGGQFQKVLLALSLLNEPNVLLVDEPTASLDELSEERVYDLLHSLQETRGLTVILVSHELSVVYRYATEVLCLSSDKTCMGPPAEILTPEKLEELYGPSPRFYRHVHGQP
jgi:zinc transport system ATP-binding protein